MPAGSRSGAAAAPLELLEWRDRGGETGGAPGLAAAPLLLLLAVAEAAWFAMLTYLIYGLTGS